MLEKVGTRMKHSKEWTTCDRCGAEIKETPHDMDLFFHKIISKEKFEMQYCETNGFIADSNLITENILSVTICEYHRVQKKVFDLCPRCRKEFERWMKNEHGKSN